MKKIYKLSIHGGATGENEIDSYFKHNGVYENLSALTGIPIDILQMPIPPLNLGTSLKESDFIIGYAKIHRLAKRNKTRRLFK